MYMIMNLHQASDALPKQLFLWQTLEEGRKCLEDVRDNYQGYDFENRLNVRVHAALRSLP